MAETEVTRKIYKWQERPESCPECDSTCFIPAGGMNLTCYHCFLTEGWDTAVVKLSEVRQETAKAIADWLDYANEAVLLPADKYKCVKKLAEGIREKYEVKL